MAGTAEALEWGIRLKIAIGAARGLAFLHSSEEAVIYRDFKTSNILLDEVKTSFSHPSVLKIYWILGFIDLFALSKLSVE